MNEYDVVCVWIGNKKYSEDYVINLYNGVKRNVTVPFKFHVITDQGIDIQSKIDCNVIPAMDISEINRADHRKAWWHKIEIFNKDNGFGKVLYLDLDMVIINRIDKFFEYTPNKFCICQDFNRQFQSKYHVSNSSIMRFTANDYHHLWDDWIKDPEHYIKKFRGDQDYMTWYFQQSTNSIQKQWWPREWAMSWKWEIEHGGKRNNGTDRNSYHQPDIEYIIPEDCSIIVCHGDPKPAELEQRFYKEWNKE